MVLEMFKEHNQKMESLVNIDYSPGTIQRYKTAYDHTKAFIRWKYSADDLELKSLSYDFVSDFAYWLKAVRKYNHNSTMKYIANFKKIVLDCIKKGLLNRDPFLGFKTTQKEVVKVALSQREIDTFKTLCIEVLSKGEDG